MSNENNNNIVWHPVTVTRQRRELQNGHRSIILWFTGLPSSGKSTVAHTVEEKLHQLGCSTFVFDGDNVRHGLCSDLGFAKEERTENIRRIGEMTKLFIEAGVIALTAFISPLRSDRQRARELVSVNDFIEIYCKCPAEICEQRDTKGHYLKAKLGEIKEFTGVSAPYEEPENPELILDTSILPVEECSEKVIDLLIERERLARNIQRESSIHVRKV